VVDEVRVRKPYKPRWLDGSVLAEKLLAATDDGTRCYRDTAHVQLSEIRSAQVVSVGRALILSECLAALPDTDRWDAEKESKRFDWILYGAEAEEIHGGCGFSKKLLHLFFQITHQTARLRQSPESASVPVTATSFLGVLENMRQWSPDNVSAKDIEIVRKGPPIIKHVRKDAGTPDYKITNAGFMTAVTAEAWRIAAIIYLLCRLRR
jgi:hypothetical protein